MIGQTLSTLNLVIRQVSYTVIIGIVVGIESTIQLHDMRSFSCRHSDCRLPRWAGRWSFAMNIIVVLCLCHTVPDDIIIISVDIVNHL
jgi:hypothetical protein